MNCGSGCEKERPAAKVKISNAGIQRLIFDRYQVVCEHILMEIKYCADCKREHPDFYQGREVKRGAGPYCQFHMRIRNARATTKRKFRDALYAMKCQQERAVKV